MSLESVVSNYVPLFQNPVYKTYLGGENELYLFNRKYVFSNIQFVPLYFFIREVEVIFSNVKSKSESFFYIPGVYVSEENSFLGTFYVVEVIPEKYKFFFEETLRGILGDKNFVF